MKKWNARDHQQNIKKKVISYYGSKCVCCGESNIIFLVIDHIEGGGTEHRKKETGWGTQFYYWLIKNNYPEGFQVLCHNCNFAKRLGICPHKISG